MPLHDRLGIPASTRASFYFYNTTEEIERLGEAVVRAQEMFGRKS
jgi:cysteine desulfurase/selenocysteine lyase